MRIAICETWLASVTAHSRPAFLHSGPINQPGSTDAAIGDESYRSHHGAWRPRGSAVPVHVNPSRPEVRGCANLILQSHTDPVEEGLLNGQSRSIYALGLAWLHDHHDDPRRTHERIRRRSWLGYWVWSRNPRMTADAGIQRLGSGRLKASGKICVPAQYLCAVAVVW